MIVLAIETATMEVGVALLGPSGLLAALTARPGRRHVETLHPAVSAVCAAACEELDAVDVVAVDVGPGLFTGVRVGVAAAQALAFGLDVPVVACLSTDVLAYAAPEGSSRVVPVVDMRRGEVAWCDAAGPDPALGGSRRDALVRSSGAGLQVGAVATLAARLAAAGEPALLVGDGARRYGDEIVSAVRELGGSAVVVAGDELAAPPVWALAELGARRAAAGRATTGGDLAPVYLRAPDARINWTSRGGASPATSPVPAEPVNADPVNGEATRDVSAGAGLAP